MPVCPRRLLLFLLPLALSGRRLPARFVPFFARIAIAHLESGLLCRFIIDDVQLDVVQALTGDNQHIGMPVPAVRGDHDLRCVAIFSHAWLMPVLRFSGEWTMMPTMAC